jgi:hypothetical protein
VPGCKRQEADVIAFPTRMLDRRALVAAYRVARTGDGRLN